MKILAGFDDSNVSKEVLLAAIDQARAFDARLFVVTVMQPSAGLVQDEKADAEEGTRIEDAQRRLEKVKDILKQKNISHETHLLMRGHDPAHDLLHFAAENEVNLIVIGVRRRSKVGKLLFGSTAQQVILKAPCPVLTVK